MNRSNPRKSLRERLHDCLPPRLWRLAASCYHLPMIWFYGRDLTRLANLLHSDKGADHGYTEFYQRHFQHLRRKPVRLLEIGIGGYKQAEIGGGSLRMWRAYFRRGRITGLDIHDKSSHRGRRIAVYQGDQSDPAVARKIIGEQGPFDIIVDDGSHRCEHIIASFELFFPSLKPGGIYAIEDTQTSYWRRYGGDAREPDRIDTTMGYFKSLVHGLNHAEISPEVRSPLQRDREIVSISFHHNLIFVEKGDNTLPSNLGASE